MNLWFTTTSTRVGLSKTLRPTFRYKSGFVQPGSDGMAGKKPKLTANFAPEVLRLFDKYVHGRSERRGFLACTRTAA